MARAATGQARAQSFFEWSELTGAQKNVTGLCSMKPGAYKRAGARSSQLEQI